MFFKRVKFVILNVTLHYRCNNGRGCTNKCTRKRVLRTCMVCVIPVRMRPLMSFPHTKSNNAKISKSKTNHGIAILCEIILSIVSSVTDFLVVSKLYFIYDIISPIVNVRSYACGYRQGPRNTYTINIYP